MAERPHLTYPVALSPGGKLFVNEQDSDAEVEDCIAVVLSWPLGTREGNPDFGVPVELFQSGGPSVSEIRHAVEANEPRAHAVADATIVSAQGRAAVTVGFDQGAVDE